MLDISSTFNHTHDVVCELSYADLDLVPKGTARHLGLYNITGVADFMQDMDKAGCTQSRVLLTFKLDMSGLVDIIKAEATCEEEPAVSQDRAEGDAPPAAPLAADDNATAENATDANAADANATDANATKAANAKKPKKKIHRRKLTVSVDFSRPEVRRRIACLPGPHAALLPLPLAPTRRSQRRSHAPPSAPSVPRFVLCLFRSGAPPVAGRGRRVRGQARGTAAPG